MPETNIEWADYVFNSWYGCQKVSPGCDRCFAESWAKRSGLVQWGPHAERRRSTEEYWKKPLQWAKKARDVQAAWERAPIVGRSRQRPERPRVFCASLADVFDNQVPAEWRDDLFRLIDATPELDWLLLTKRPENALIMLPRHCGKANINQVWPWPNIWLGFTAEDQAHFDRRWPIIRDIPAAVRFCSYEPALGPLRVGPRREWPDLRGNDSELHWLICGGESGPGHRPFDLQWEEDIRLDCAQAGIAYFLKQNAGKKPFPDGYPIVRQFPETRPAGSPSA